MRLAPLGLLVLLAGCAAPAPPPVAEASAPPPAEVPLVWELGDCEAMAWEVPVPASRLATRLPPGYTPMPLGAPEGPAADVPDGLEQVAVLGFEAVECATGFASSERVARSVPFARIYTPVVPPAGQADPRAGAQHAYTWAVVVADDEWRTRLAALGLPVDDGATLVGPSAQGYTARIAFDDLGVFSLTGRPDATAQARPDAPFRDFSLAHGGVASWVGSRANWTVANGLGLWDATPGSWVADVLGGTSGAATFHLDQYSIPHEAIIRPSGAGGSGTGPHDD